MKREVRVTADGSSTIYIPAMDENYHSTHGAIQEAMHVFIKHGLTFFETHASSDAIRILELGFGTGLNALLTSIHQTKKIEYVGIEAFPVEMELIDQLNYFEVVGEEHGDCFHALHTAPWEKKTVISPLFSLTKVAQKVQLLDLVPASFDLIYFDAFGPRAQAEMWEKSIIEKMVNALDIGGSLVSYCAMGQFKRDLKSLGMKIEVLPGPPGKREMTRAIKLPQEQ